MIKLNPVANDTRALRTLFSYFPSGVVAVCSTIDSEPVGMAASSFTSVSLHPPLVSFCVQNTSDTWPRLRKNQRIGISVLAEDHESQCLQLSKKGGNRFESVDWGHTAQGSVFIKDAAVWLDCSIHDEIAAGDHTIVVLDIHAINGSADVSPLIFHQSRFWKIVADAG